MKKLLDLWKNLFLKYFDINQNGKLDLFELSIIISLIFIYNIFFEILGNYVYDLIK
jgi:hypothetical protein|tara:strand:+ start:298 stop:465 length:168 start_codon:yes stop_codon:yes gene_type:complete